MLELLAAAAPPSHLLLGSDALRYVGSARQEFDAETLQWQALSRSTDF